MNLDRHIQRLFTSYQRYLGKAIPSPQSLNALDQASFALVSHGTESDPVFNYANQTALQLFEYDWERFTRLPSRLSAEPINQQTRAQVLAQVSQHGFYEGYQGVRVSGTGKRFLIQNATVWNVVDEAGHYHGQAALIPQWVILP